MNKLLDKSVDDNSVIGVNIVVIYDAVPRVTMVGDPANPVGKRGKSERFN